MKHGHAPLAAQHSENIRVLEQQLFCTIMVQRCTNLIDELQRERGLGQLLLSWRGECYATALREQMHLSQEAEQAWLTEEAHWARLFNDTHGGLDHHLARRAQLTRQSHPWQQLHHIRQQVFWLGSEPERIFNAYCQLIAELLTTVQICIESVTDAFLRSELNTLRALMWCKEYSGQERTSGVVLFTSGRYQVHHWQKMCQLTEAQQQCASQFICQARPALRQQFKNALNLETQAELEGLRQLLTHGTEEDPLEPQLAEAWFRACSWRMNELREVEREQLEAVACTLQQRLTWLQTQQGKQQAPNTHTTTPLAVGSVLRTAAAWLVHASSGSAGHGGLAT